MYLDLDRLTIHLTREIPEEQAGFVKERGCRDQIFNIRTIMEKAKEFQVPLFMCFIDYSKCFDSIHHDHLWNMMIEMGFPRHLVQLFERLYVDQKASVKCNIGMTEWFNIEKGARQGVHLHLPYLTYMVNI